MTTRTSSTTNAMEESPCITTKPADRSNEILTLSFNQDFTALAMGTKQSYALFSISRESRVAEIHDGGIQALTNIPYLPYEEVIYIERLFSSSLLAIVTRQAPRKLRVCHYKKGSEICAYVFPNDIRAIKMNRTRLVVCLEDSIYIHNMSDMKLLHSMKDLAVNPDGLCALSPSNDNPFLAYPASSMTGEIQLFNTVALKPTLLLSAHESQLAAIAFDSSGTRIASASSRGTLIRVHHAVDGTRLFEVRRSARRTATIYSLAFSPDAMFLAVSADTGTIHIFRLVDQREKPVEPPTTWMGTFGQMLGGVTTLLPTRATEVLTQDRAFAIVHQTGPPTKTIVGMNSSNQTLRLFVVGYDGIVHIYEVNTTEGGECKQTSQYILFHLSDAALQQLPNAETNASSDERRSVYPSNVLRTEDRNRRVTPVLTNERFLQEAESFQTTHGDDSNQTVPTGDSS